MSKPDPNEHPADADTRETPIPGAGGEPPFGVTPCGACFFDFDNLEITLSLSQDDPERTIYPLQSLQLVFLETLAGGATAKIGDPVVLEPPNETNWPRYTTLTRSVNINLGAVEKERLQVLHEWVDVNDEAGSAPIDVQ